MKTKIPVRKKKYQHDFRYTHLTTFDFSQTRPVSVIPCLEGDNVKVNFMQTTQMSPLAVPTYGSFDLKFSHFFVPSTSVFEHYHEYRMESQDTSLSQKKILPFTQPWVFFQLLFGGEGLSYSSDAIQIDNEFETYGYVSGPLFVGDLSTLQDYGTIGICSSSGSGSSTVYDFNHDFVFAGKLFDVQEEFYNYWYIDLTLKGRQLLNIFEGLGYSIPRILSFEDSVGAEQCAHLLSDICDATPLLSFFRVFYDYIYPSEYLPALGVGGLFPYSSSQMYLEFSDLKKLLNLVFTSYRSDFWTSQFVSPNLASSGSNPFGAVANSTAYYPGNNLLMLSTNNNVNVIHQETSSKTQTLSSYALRWLESASDYVLRNNLAGSRFKEWMKVHFGLFTEAETKFCSQFIKSDSSNIVIRRIVNQAETSQMLLGELGGEGSSGGSYTFSYDAKEDGFIISLAVLIPQVGYVHGCAPWTIYPSSPKDLYLEEFDSVGYEAVPRKLLYSKVGLRSFDGSLPTDAGGSTIAGDSMAPNSVFGYLPRNSYRYRYMPDLLTGDFAVNSRNALLGSYHTFRDLTPYAVSDTLKNNLNWKQITTDFDRVFAVPSNDERNFVDHFITIFNFHVHKTSVVKSASDSLPLFDKSGEDVNIEYMGN